MSSSFLVLIALFGLTAALQRSQSDVQIASESVINFHSKDDPSGKKIPAEFRNEVEEIEVETLGFMAGFVNSLAMILVCELGDKTFFIAAILSMRHDALIVYAGAIGALAIMTVLSAAMGFALPNLIPRAYTHWAAMLLFAYFGVVLLKDAYELYKKGEGEGASDELEEVEEELNEKKNQNRTKLKVFLQALSLTFLAEWGDRSQIATIALAAAKDPYGVIVGGILGHAICTGLACVGGRMLASKISERTVLTVGGILFLVFAVHSCFDHP